MAPAAPRRDLSRLCLEQSPAGEYQGRLRIELVAGECMAYSLGLIAQLDEWLDAGIIPPLGRGDRIIELGDQMLNDGTPPEPVIKFIKKFKPDFDSSEIARALPVNHFGVTYTYEMWRRCGFDYLSYDVTEAPYSKVFDLNFHAVPEEDRQTAMIVTNIGTTEHIANQLNAFRVIHDLLKVGGVAIHSVPFAGMLNHSFFNYHPKFFFSLIVNNRYRLRKVIFNEPSPLGAGGNSVYDGDYLTSATNAEGSPSWALLPLYSGTVNLVIERMFVDEFVPPVDFAGGYFGDFPKSDLSLVLGVDQLPYCGWADAYRRSATPSQSATPSGPTQPPSRPPSLKARPLQRLRRTPLFLPPQRNLRS